MDILTKNSSTEHLGINLQMEKKCWLFAFLLIQVLQTEAAGVRGGFGLGVGNGGAGGGGGVWIGGDGGGGGIGSTDPSAPFVSRMQDAYIALQAWKTAITDDPLGILRSWVGSNVCIYKGVFCAESHSELGATADPVVTGIDLNNANLQGSLVKELSLLTDMTLLHLNSNRFSGTIPNTFGDLSSLQELDLSNNLLSGSFPAVTLEIPDLIYLDLRFNSFSGPIPEEIFNKRLDAILLNNNQFGGEIPQNLASSSASVINLANNRLSGNIPAGLGFMGSKLKEILFLNNQLTGCIPEGIGLFTDLEVFDASFNSLMGQLPDTISCLSDIEVLNLAHNKLSGVLPDILCSVKSLLNLTVAYNFFSGFSPECTRFSTRNVGFDISVNCIPGRDMQRPQPECSGIPGSGLNCLRIPAVQPLVCGTLMVSNPQSLVPSPP